MRERIIEIFVQLMGRIPIFKKVARRLPDVEVLKNVVSADLPFASVNVGFPSPRYVERLWGQIDSVLTVKIRMFFIQEKGDAADILFSSIWSQFWNLLNALKLEKGITGFQLKDTEVFFVSPYGILTIRVEVGLILEKVIKEERNG